MNKDTAMPDANTINTCGTAQESVVVPSPPCLYCGTALTHTMVDLGMSPLCESYVAAAEVNKMEPFYPLHVRVCEKCFLVQLEEYVSPEDIFTEYAYFSSFSSSWLRHASAYVEMITSRLELDADSHVVELASNDGYLLQYFIERGIPALGIEPAANVAQAAIEKGIPTEVIFFNEESARRLAEEGKHADLILGNNVLAQVPDVNSFVKGMKILLKPDGVVTIEFPHLERLMEENKFDTIYHEHFFYFSLHSANTIFAAHGLTLFDVEELKSHGGSLRIYACHVEDDSKPVSQAVQDMLAREEQAGFRTVAHYEAFGEQVRETKRKLLEFLIDAKRAGKRVVGYGAPGKGNTLLNYCGIRQDFVDFTVDRNPYKQGRFLPGSRIPILAPEVLETTDADYVLILPWNLKDEIIAQLDPLRQRGMKFVVPIPEVTIYE
jgi:SAM-dependent methyltransferase